MWPRSGWASWREPGDHGDEAMTTMDQLREVAIALAAGVAAFLLSSLIFILLVGEWRGPGIGAILAGLFVTGYVWWVRRMRRRSVG
jgi:hypothetical protein